MCCARHLHPDKNSSPGATDAFKRVGAAYTTLCALAAGVMTSPAKVFPDTAAVSKADRAAQVAERRLAMEEEKKKREAEKETREQKKDGVCTFWFVKAWYIRKADGPLPAFQDLKKIAPEDALTKVTGARRNAFGGTGQNKYGGHLAISHRWETGKTPDAKGVQMKKIQDYLTDHEDIDLVWCDFW